MAFIDRASQIANRAWDAFSPLKRLTADQKWLHSLRNPLLLRDVLLDGISITRKDVAAYWINENTVHRAARPACRAVALASVPALSWPTVTQKMPSAKRRRTRWSRATALARTDLPAPPIPRRARAVL